MRVPWLFLFCPCHFYYLLILPSLGPVPAGRGCGGAVSTEGTFGLVNTLAGLFSPADLYPVMNHDMRVSWLFLTLLTCPLPFLSVAAEAFKDEESPK